MSKSDDPDEFKQTLRATFFYRVLALVFMVGTFPMILRASGEELRPAKSVPVLLERAHSHNDYHRKRPLTDALELGFCSVEADIHLVEGALLVAHDLHKAEAARTLETLYLKPLWERFEKQGSIHATPASFTLLIDIKSDGKTTFAVLHETLKRFAPMLTRFTPTTTTPGAVTVVISGNRAMDSILSTEPRLAGIDGRLSDLDENYTVHDMPLISDNWMTHFTWRGKGPLSDEESKKLRAIVSNAHEKGMRVRFWAIPQRASVWKALYDADVDLLNADNLSKLSVVLREAMGEN